MDEDLGLINKFCVSKTMTKLWRYLKRLGKRLEGRPEEETPAPPESF